MESIDAFKNQEKEVKVLFPAFPKKKCFLEGPSLKSVYPLQKQHVVEDVYGLRWNDVDRKIRSTRRKACLNTFMNYLIKRL
jgi:hypothetical protein